METRDLKHGVCEACQFRVGRNAGAEPCCRHCLLCKAKPLLGEIILCFRRMCSGPPLEAV
jgi:hypothetical protein